MITAFELLIKYPDYTTSELMIEFAKLHCEAQAKAIKETINPSVGVYIVQDNIDKIYNLDNIK